MMKRIAFILVGIVALLGFVGGQEVNAQNKAVIEAPQPEHNFGTIKESDGPVKHVFEIKNNGNSPLVITRVMSSCGCTTPKFNRDPIAPGAKGEIIVVYDPTGRVYPFVKTVSVYSNGKEGPIVLTIKGEVVK